MIVEDNLFFDISSNYLKLITLITIDSSYQLLNVHFNIEK